MDKLFLQILDMSITSIYVIIFVIAARLCLKKFPKIFSYVLWSAVFFRLIFPFSIEGVFSLIPGKTIVPQNIGFMPKPEINSGIRIIDRAVNNVLPPATPTASINPMQVWIGIGQIVWITGIFIIAAYSIFTTFKLYKNIRYAKHIEQNIYELANLKSPFVFGILNPKIFIPSGIGENEKPYILLHEKIHIKRFDHVIKPIAFLISSIHWFNPFVWLGFFLMSEDMELSCDEKVVKEMGSGIKKEYSSSLLTMSTGRKIAACCPLAFGENNTKGRIKNILNYKKPALWLTIVSVIIITTVIVGLITNPRDTASLNDLRPMIMVNGILYLDTGKQVPAEIDESAIIGLTISSVLQTEKPKEDGQTNFGLVGAKYAYFEENIVVLINNEWTLFEKESTIETIENGNLKNENTYDKIYAYLKEKSISAFSFYYELIDFKISDYNEEIVNGNIESVFWYKIIHKNYDKDPDTVQYIKEAKESGDKNYQIYYDEYLKAQEMNFYFKALVEKNGQIILFTKNPTIESEWEKVELSDYVIGKITEKHQSEKRNRKDPVENDIADYISYDYLESSIYFAGLRIFDEFWTETFGFTNEGRARIIKDEDILEFFIEVHTGLLPATGSISGPTVYFKMALDTNEIIEKEFIPAPNYEEAAKLHPEHINSDSIQYSEKTIELSDKGMAEIGLYFKEFILKIESELSSSRRALS